MSVFHQLLRRSSSSPLRPLFSYLLSRHLAFSSAEEAAAERRRRKRRLRIEPPLPPRPSSAPRAARDPREPDTTSSLVGPRLSLHNRIQSLIRSRDLDSASSAARHAVHSPVRPSVFTCNALISALHRAGRIPEAVALFRFFFDQSRIAPNVVSYNLLILSLCDSSRVDDALAAYRRLLESAPFLPSAVTFRHLTRGLVDAARLPEAVLLLREMLSRGLAADSLVYNNLISGFLQLDDLPKALELFDELRERCVVYDGAVTATFMDWYFRRDRPRDAMDAYRTLKEKKFEMSPATCNALLEVLLRHGKESEAEHLFDGMLSRHAPPRLHALNTDTYNIVVDAWFRKGDPEGAVEAFRRTGAKPCAMDVDCFNNVIRKLLENGLQERARELFDEMPVRLVNPDATTFGLFIAFFFREGKVEDALRWFESLVSQVGEKAPRVRVDSYNQMYDGLVKAGRIGAAMEMFGEMKERGIGPDSASYEILVAASCEEGLLDQVRALVEEMVRLPVAHSPELQERVFAVFSKEGRDMEVEGMFKPPQCVVPPALPSQSPHPPQSFHQRPNHGAYHPSYNAGIQSSYTGGLPSSAVNVGGPPHSPGDQGIDFASTYQRRQVAGYQPSQFASHQPINGSSHEHVNANAIRVAAQSSSFDGSQTARFAAHQQIKGSSHEDVNANAIRVAAQSSSFDGSQAIFDFVSTYQPQQVAGYQPSQFASRQPINGASCRDVNINALRVATRSSTLDASQTGFASSCQPQQVAGYQSSQFTFHQSINGASCKDVNVDAAQSSLGFASSYKPQQVAGYPPSQFASHQLIDTESNVSCIPAQSSPLDGSRTVNSMLPQSTGVTDSGIMETASGIDLANTTQYTVHSQAWQGMHPHANRFQHFGGTLRSPHEAASFQAPNNANPSQASHLSASDHTCRSSRIPRPSNVGEFWGSRSPPPSYLFRSQKGITSQIPESTDPFSSSSSCQQGHQPMNPGTRGVSSSGGSRPTVSPQVAGTAALPYSSSSCIPNTGNTQPMDSASPPQPLQGFKGTNIISASDSGSHSFMPPQDLEVDYPQAAEAGTHGRF